MLVRALVVLLACMNVGVAAWWALHRDPVTAEVPSSEKGIASLQLLHEVAKAPVTEVEEISAEPELPRAGSVCLSLGPFRSAAELRRAMNQLMPRVEQIQFRETAATEVQGYKVFLPPAASRAQALDAARALAAQGISDYYVVTAGDQQNTISLGIFRDLENATKRHDTVAALGYDPTVEPRTEQTRQWWIDLAAAPGFAWKDLLPGIEQQASPVPCN
jgi:hypothetical protein